MTNRNSKNVKSLECVETGYALCQKGSGIKNKESGVGKFSPRPTMFEIRS